jgi:hypothetical protein
MPGSIPTKRGSTAARPNRDIALSSHRRAPIASTEGFWSAYHVVRYGNALLHDTPDADLEAKDLLLESASIRFSSRILYGVIKTSSQSDEHAAIGTAADRTFVLDDKFVGLRV